MELQTGNAARGGHGSDQQLDETGPPPPAAGANNNNSNNQQQQQQQVPTSNTKAAPILICAPSNAAIDEVRSKSHKNSKQNLSSDFFVNVLEDKDDLNSQVDSIGIKNLLSNLKEKCIQIIHLLYFKGYTQKEAAEELAIPVGTVKTRNRSCIAQIRGNIAI